ncbi:MAG: hypothetical protein E4G95_05395 [Bacteroidia bacterium]|nr:MAG: hypothetical protein E4G95_05395 [Bacteroidia bacterium]
MRPIVAFLVIILLSFSSCKFIREKGWFGTKKKADPVAVWQAQQDSIRVADSIRAEIELMRQFEQARLDSIMVAEQSRLDFEARFRYHIIVGSFLTREYAEDYKNMYRSMGYDANIIPDSQNRFNLVSAEVHETLQKAHSRLVRYQDTVEFESWVYIDF